MTSVSSTPAASNAGNVTAVSRLKRRLRLNSFGVKLFCIITGGTLLSILGVAFLFSETTKLQAEEQIQKIIAGKVGTIREVTDRAETLADSLGISVATLHVRGAATPETYQELTRKLFEEHPDFIVGLGFGQKENGILPSEQWFYPYYQELRFSPDAVSQLLEESDDSASAIQRTARVEKESDLRYIDRASESYFYPDTEAYRTYFLPQKNLWTSPYQSNEGITPLETGQLETGQLETGQTDADKADTEAKSSLLLTYYSQIFDNENEWIGTAVVDVDDTYLSEIIDAPIYRGQGSLILVSENGDIIANPAAPDTVERQTYVNIPGLTEIWSKINAEANTQAVGLIEGDRGYWSYSKVPDQSWLVVAYVPYWAVFERIVLVSLAAVLPAGLLMAGLTALVVRSLNRRLRPVIDECQRLSSINGVADPQFEAKDELEQLSTSFFSLLEQLNLSSTQPYKSAQLHSPQQLQREIMQLNEAVSSLAQASEVKGNRLSKLLSAGSDRTDASSADSRRVNSSEVDLVSSDIISIQARLDQIFPQVLAALDQFSRLLSAFNQTQDAAVLIQDIMLSANRDIEMQTTVVNQLQACAVKFQPLSEGATREISQLGTGREQRGLATYPELNTLQATSSKVSEQMRALSHAVDSAHRKTKDYQNIASMAQVLIINSSTLAISASRQQSAETQAEIVAQLQSKEAALKALAEQLETAQLEQQKSRTSVQALISELDTTVSTLALSMQQVDGLSLPSENGRASAPNQQLVQQANALCEYLEQMKALTNDMSQHIDSTLQQTRQIGAIKADVALAIGPSER